MKRLLSSLLALGLMAQAPVLTQPQPVTTTDASSTIAATNTFQQVFAASTLSVGSPRRSGCLIINNSTNRQWVFFGAIASADKAKSVPLEPASATNALGGSVSCQSAGIVLQDQVSITGTMGDTFVAKSQ